MPALYLDEDVRSAATARLRSLGHDANHTRELQPGAKDDVQLLTAARAGRILITANHKDFTLLHDAWCHWAAEWGMSRQHPGILLVTNTWSEDVVAERVDAFFSSARSTANRLYRWIDGRDWVEHITPGL